MPHISGTWINFPSIKVSIVRVSFQECGEEDLFLFSHGKFKPDYPVPRYWYIIDMKEWRKENTDNAVKVQ